MQLQKLTQSNQRRLDFWGDELLKRSTKKGREDDHWWVVRIFRATRSYVVGISYKTTFKLDEDDLFVVFEVNSKEQVVALVNEVIPELTGSVAKVLHLRFLDQERLRKELERWKKKNPEKGQELSLLKEKEESQPPSGWPVNDTNEKTGWKDF